MTKYSSSQFHGKFIENRIKEDSGMFLHISSDCRENEIQKLGFDIGPEFDHRCGLATQVKSCNRNSGRLFLSDASKFWKNTLSESYRMLIGMYFQIGDEKKFYEIHEIIIRPSYSNKLFGGITEQDVIYFHKKLKEDKLVCAEIVRVWASNHKKTFENRKGLVQLNPKVGSEDNQRRLQCSVSIKDLLNIVDEKDYCVYKDKYGYLSLPIICPSGKRKRNKKVNEDLLVVMGA